LGKGVPKGVRLSGQVNAVSLSNYFAPFVILIERAPTASLFLELNPRTSFCPVAQPLSALAHGNLLRPQDGQDRLCRVLGLHGTGKKTTASLPEVDS
jgi:hypothetical protein